MDFKGVGHLYNYIKAKGTLKKVWNDKSKAASWDKVFLDVAILCNLESKWEKVFQNKDLHTDHKTRTFISNFTAPVGS